MRNACDIDWASRLSLFANRPRALEHGAYIKALPKPIFNYLLASDLHERRRRIRAMIDVLAEYPVAVAVKAAKAALQYQRTDRASVMSFAAFATNPGAPPPIEEPWTPGEVAGWSPGLSDYDQLVAHHG